MLELKLDCRHFRGDKPCRYARLCAGCPDYDPMGTRILVVKLDAIGDVARTMTILRPLRKKYAPCHVTWIASPAALDLLREHPLVERPLAYDAASLASLRVERFDVVFSLDKTPRAAGVAMSASAPVKVGFGLSEFGTVYPMDANAEYAFQLGLDDELKFRRNERTYQDVIFEVCGLEFRGEEYEIPLPEADRRHAAEFAAGVGICDGDVVVGVNLGGGAMFANKMWDAAQTIEFLRLVRERVECKVLLFGAEMERDKTADILSRGLPDVFSAGLDNTLKQFQALIGLCHALVGGDSLGMHLALAERTQQVVLFGPTCHSEIELYGRGEKIVSPLPCGPCYRRTCAESPNCMEAVEPGVVVEAALRRLAAGGRA